MLHLVKSMRLVKIIFAIFCLFFLSTIAFSQINLSNTQKRDIIKQAPNLSLSLLNLSLKAYNHAVSEKLSHKPILTIIDYSIPSNKNRLWIIDLRRAEVLENTLVAHGKGSGTPLKATHFSDVEGSKASSVGTYITGGTYYGKNGLSLRLYGVIKNFNDKAYERTVVLHPAWYVSEDFAHLHGYVGRSWGCPAVSKSQSRKIISIIKNGTVLFIYYPHQGLEYKQKLEKPSASTAELDVFDKKNCSTFYIN